MKSATTVQHSRVHNWHVLYNGVMVLRGLKTEELAQIAAKDIEANGGRLPRKSRRSNRLDLRGGVER